MKKIIAVMAALVCVAVLFNINTFADTSSVNGGINSGGGGVGGNRTSYGQGTELFIKAVIDFAEGDISYEQFTNRTSEIVGDYMSEYTDRAGLAFMSEISGKISETVAKYGLDAPTYVSEWIYDIIDDFTETEEVPNTDKNGYGTKIVARHKQYSSIGYEACWDGYIEIEENSDGTTTYWCMWSGTERYYVDLSSGRVSVSVPTSNHGQNDTDYNVTVYGDVRYSDGSPAPTDDETSTVTKINLDELSDTELEELLEDILEELERQDPDLSTIEGLLESIYYRLGALDSDNDNELLSDINTAILALANNNGNQEMIEILLLIRDELKGEDSGTSEDEDSGETGDSSGTSDGHPEHICGTLYNVKPLDKNWLNKLFTDTTELKVEYQGNKYYLQSCGCLLLDDKYYAVDMNYDSYTNIDFDFNNTDIEISPDITSFNYVNMNLTEGQKKKIDNIVEMISTLVAKGVPMSAVNGGLMFYQDIIFNSSDPEDIVVNFDFYGEKYSATILSTSFFNSEAAQALQIVKNFVSIVICYAWLLTMRRKASSMLGG